MTIDLGNLDVGVAILYKKRVRKFSDGVSKAAYLVLRRGRHSLSRSAMRSLGSHSWVNRIRVLPVSTAEQSYQIPLYLSC